MRRMLATLALLICSLGAVRDNLPKPDPGLAQLAVRNLATLRTIPFAGGYDAYSGYGAPPVRDYMRRYRAALRHGVPPSFLAKRPWINSIAGPGSEKKIFRFRNGVVVFQEFCEAHNCGGNNVYVLYAPNSQRLWGVVTSYKGPAYAFGSPSAGEASLNLIVLAQQAVGYVLHSEIDTFPLSERANALVKQHILKANGDLTAAAADIEAEMMRSAQP